MKSFSYHELNPLIRLKEMELLPAEMWERLINARDLKEVKELLQPTVYGEFLTADFAEDFEAALAKKQEHTIAELVTLAPEPEVVWIYTMRFTFHNLKALTKAELLNETFDELFIPDGFYSLEQIKSAVKTGQGSGLPESILTSIQEVKEHFEESDQLQGIDIIYDRTFLRCQKQVSDALGYPELAAEVASFIDLTNVIMLGRGIKQKRSRAFMSTVLSSSGTLAKAELLDYAEEPLEAFSTFVLTTPYGEIIAPAITTGDLDLALLEKVRDDHLTQLFEAAQVQAFGPLPLLAYLNAQDNEIKNLRLITVGKRIGLAPERLRERMRQSYDT
ncbi:V-type ATPase subunit [Enterococcus sp. CSURQ0835]|uniref:V-type ATPase subunit n=1 Tax=Enterococcus sp. CSURQ0835 TaxID=2681394 RepID=UPI0013584B6D|nr:V-type ATPase subunit [Enterococcus sp. CSURQ0835]